VNELLEHGVALLVDTCRETHDIIIMMMPSLLVPLSSSHHHHRAENLHKAHASVAAPVWITRVLRADVPKNLMMDADPGISGRRSFVQISRHRSFARPGVMPCEKEKIREKPRDHRSGARGVWTRGNSRIAECNLELGLAIRGLCLRVLASSI
jgi:hypothetical protein